MKTLFTEENMALIILAVIVVGIVVAMTYGSY